MFKKPLIIFIFFLPLLGFAQADGLLQELLSTSTSHDSAIARMKLQEFEQQLKKKEFKSDYAFLETVFAKTQRKFLRRYTQYTELDKVFSSGKYDCLTATSLFSVVLSDLNFKYRIIETNYHIFLLVQTSHGDILLETTDAYNGFVSDPKEIEKRLGSYKQNLITAAPASNKLLYSYHFNLYQDVAPHQLAGLLYYNQAVKAFNKKELLKSADLLDQAKAIYESPRVAELAVLIIHTAFQSNLPESERLLERYKIYWERRSNLMAAR